MEEEDSIFDPSLKKKKKKKTGFNLEAALAEGQKSTEAAPEAENGEAGSPSLKKKKKKTGFNLDAALEGEDEDKNKSDEKTDEGGEKEGDDVDTELFGKKKSSKKKKAFNFDEINEALDGTAAPEEGGEGQVDSAAPDIDMDLEFNFSSKKKKTRKKNVDIEKLIADDEKEKKDGDDKEKEEAWGDSERDYSYDELLQRAFDLLREKNPEMASGEKKKFIMKPPHVLRIGSKKSAFANFSEICKLLHRMPNHVLQFLLAELGTSGSIDGNSQLIIKGRFQQKQIENVLRRYIKEYVTCHTCRSSDTILQKDARLYFLQCEQCNSRCSVAQIKSGFQAVANKQQRQAIRASKD